MIQIEDFKPEDQETVRKLVLHIQNVEFELGLVDEDQPDLLDTEGFYKNGGFWVARKGDEIVGTIGIQRLSNKNAVLRKMFVKERHRGGKPSIAQQLYDHLMEFVRSSDIEQIYLDTPAKAGAAHRFYERNGFVHISEGDIPQDYHYTKRLNLRFYSFHLN